MQLQWYTEVLLPVSPHHDYNVQAMQIDPARCREKGDWQESIHLSGAAYYYNDKTRTYTEMNVGTCLEEQLTRLKSWIDASRSKIDGKQWLLVIDPMLARGEEVYPYYYVVPENQIITWVEPIDGYILFQECTVWHWNHKSTLVFTSLVLELSFAGLELEAQYWKHVEYFPHGVAIPVLEAKSQTTVASVIMAVNASILAIPGLGSQLTTKTLCSISFLLSVYCIIGCTMAQHFAQRLKPLDFTAYYLQEKMLSLVILTSIPSFLYLMSLAFSMLGFLAGIFTVDFGLPLFARLRCGLTFMVGAGLVIPLVIASLTPGLIRQ
ncbi:hypothetical protein BD769DRAFT_1659671 [Suillus cothurnatus]|nr:hypothetical protein BD769DRAFT_1659671 [Suillus cothurnatus]